MYTKIKGIYGAAAFDMELAPIYSNKDKDVKTIGELDCSETIGKEHGACAKECHQLALTVEQIHEDINNQAFTIPLQCVSVRIAKNFFGDKLAEASGKTQECLDALKKDTEVSSDWVSKMASLPRGMF